MSHMNKIFIAAACAAILSAGTASAATLGFVGGNAVASVPGNFGALGDASGVGTVPTPTNLTAPLTKFDAGSSVFGDGLSIIGSGMVTVTLTYLGFEAGNTNTGASLFAPGQSFLNQGIGANFTGDKITFTQSAGVPLLLSFSSSNSNGLLCSVDNGNYPGAAGCQVAFSSIFEGGTATYAMFGDGAGDSDLDDMVIRIDVSPVPVPAAGLLLLAGLGGLAAMKRRKTV